MQPTMQPSAVTKVVIYHTICMKTSRELHIGNIILLNTIALSLMDKYWYRSKEVKFKQHRLLSLPLNLVRVSVVFCVVTWCFDSCLYHCLLWRHCSGKFFLIQKYVMSYWPEKLGYYIAHHRSLRESFGDKWHVAKKLWHCLGEW